MNKIEAATLIQDYWNSIKDLRPYSIFLSNSSLPCTVGKIKYAHFVFGEALIIDGEMVEGAEKLFMESFGLIHSLFREHPDTDNQKYREYLDGLKNGNITDFRHPNPFGESGAVAEYYNFLGEAIFKYQGRQLSDSVLESFVYDALTNKAVAETDIKCLIRLVNTSLTRSVTFPDKKKNEECVFV